jgi:hypothetical protein
MDRERPRRSIDPDLAHHDSEQARSHARNRVDPGRTAQWPKDDQRSSSRLAQSADHLTNEERGAAWPLG